MEKIWNGKTEVNEHYAVVKIIKYTPQRIIDKTILKTGGGNITARAFATGKTIKEKNIPFDTFIQLIDGEAEVYINRKKHRLCMGMGLIIPAHSAHSIKANRPFKMISTIIKSGYEDNDA